jgi:hypothetical protein
LPCEADGPGGPGADMEFLAEWQADHPVSNAVCGADGSRKDLRWLPPGTVADLYEQFKALVLLK